MEQETNELLKKAKNKYDEKKYAEALELYNEISETIEETTIYKIFCSISILSIDEFIKRKESIIEDMVKINDSLDNIRNRLGLDNRKYIESWLEIYRDYVKMIKDYHKNITDQVNKVFALADENELMKKAMELRPEEVLQYAENLTKDVKIANANHTEITKNLIFIHFLVATHIAVSLKETPSLISKNEVQEIADNVINIFKLEGDKEAHTDELREQSNMLWKVLMMIKEKANYEEN